jgi:mono/diheme cytochrome c family protein
MSAAQAAARRATPVRALAMTLCALGLVCSGHAQAAEAEHTGRQVFDKWCAPCHAAGPDHPGTTALAALYKGAKPAALEDAPISRRPS